MPNLEDMSIAERRSAAVRAAEEASQSDVEEFGGGGRSSLILYKGHHHKLRSDGRSEFILSKGVRVSLAKVRAWQTAHNKSAPN